MPSRDRAENTGFPTPGPRSGSYSGHSLLAVVITQTYSGRERRVLRQRILWASGPRNVHLIGGGPYVEEAGTGPADVEEAIQAVRGQRRAKEGRIEEGRTDPAEDRP